MVNTNAHKNRSEIDEEKYEYNLKQIDDLINRVKNRYVIINGSYSQRFFSILVIFVTVMIFFFQIKYFKRIINHFFILPSSYELGILILGVVLVVALVLMYMMEDGRWSPSKDMDNLMESIFRLKREYVRDNEGPVRMGCPLGLTSEEKEFLHQFHPYNPIYHRDDLFDFLIKLIGWLFNLPVWLIKQFGWLTKLEGWLTKLSDLLIKPFDQSINKIRNLMPPNPWPRRIKSLREIKEKLAKTD
jgi:hypothetical protein|tara:strand:+ start:492 stop:1223 length:732 start_codon:yes stop_codon:yes gene_type:complete